MSEPRMRNRLTGLEALTFQVPQAAAGEYMVDEPDDTVVLQPWVVAGFWLPSTWPAYDIRAVWLMWAAPAVAGKLHLFAETSLFADGDALGAATAAGNVTIPQATVTARVGHLNLTTLATGVVNPHAGVSGGLLGVNVGRQPADANDTVSILGSARLGAVVITPNYDT